MKNSKWLFGIGFLFLSSFYISASVEACSNFGGCNNSKHSQHFQKNGCKKSHSKRNQQFKNQKNFPKLYPTYSYINEPQTMDLEMVPVNQYNYRTQHYYRQHYKNISVPVYAKNYYYNPNTHKRVYRYVSNGLEYFVTPLDLNYRYSNY